MRWELAINIPIRYRAVLNVVRQRHASLPNFEGVAHAIQFKSRSQWLLEAVKTQPQSRDGALLAYSISHGPDGFAKKWPAASNKSKRSSTAVRRTASPLHARFKKSDRSSGLKSKTSQKRLCTRDWKSSGSIRKLRNKSK
jgi:hypothetical protein